MNEPKLRFPEFTGDWKSCKVSEVAEKTFGGGTPKTSNETFWIGDIPWIQSSDLVDGNLFDINPKKYISQEAINKSAAKLIPENSIAVVTRVGVGKLMFIPFSYATSQDFLSLSGLKTEPQFTSYSLYKRLQQDLCKVQGTSIKGITKDELLIKEIMVPSYEEQKKIGECLHSVDVLIQSAEKELEGYRELKQGMLQKMFPKKGEKVPEIRFPEFTGDWEQRKLGDVCKTNGRIGFRGYTEKDIITKEAGGVLTFSPTNIVDNQLTIEAKNTYITREKYEESPEIMVRNGNILFVKTGSTLGKSALVSEIKEDCTVNPQVVVIKADVELQKILSVVLISASVQKQIAAIKIGGAVPTMTEAELKNIDLMLPQSDDEKIKLGEYFSNLDNLIALQQKELDGYKELKKGLLQQMFC